MKEQKRSSSRTSTHRKKGLKPVRSGGQALQPGVIYHIYNRGVNGETIFREERNYAYFLDLFRRHIPPAADTFAFCLLKNHFHFLIRTKKNAG